MRVRDQLTDDDLDRVLLIAAGFAEDWYYADDEYYEVDHDRSWCPWLRRSLRLPGADPEGTCSFGCREEPDCQTGGPHQLHELAIILKPFIIHEEESDDPPTATRPDHRDV